MLREEPRHAADPGTLRKFIQRSISFPQSNGLILIVKRRQQIPKTPNPALVNRFGR